LENYVQEDLGNTSITVLQGHVMVELSDQGKNYSLKEGDTMQVGGVYSMAPVNESHSLIYKNKVLAFTMNIPTK